MRPRVRLLTDNNLSAEDDLMISHGPGPCRSLTWQAARGMNGWRWGASYFVLRTNYEVQELLTDKDKEG